MNTKKQIALIVLDGWGYREEEKNNAIAEADTPVFDKIWKECPHTLLKASGLAVGLPEGQMGNSEVGHMTIGAGRTIDTDLVRIDKAIENGQYAKNPVFLELFEHVKKNNSVLHVMGLLSDGGVHSHIDHLFAFLKCAKENAVEKIAIHAFLDGRDTPPQSGAGYLRQLENFLPTLSVGQIATISGRYYAMDRDNNLDRLKKAEEAIFEGKGEICQGSPSEYLENLYKQNKIDETLEPVVCLDKNGESLKVEKHDGIFFFNFRTDRARELSRKIIEKSVPEDLFFVSMTDYGEEFKNPVAFPPIKIETTLGKEISLAGLTQARIAETEKFAHATYFLNGGEEKPYQGEEDILLASHKDVPTHDLAPKMRAEGIADKAVEQIEKGTNFIFVNFANADMVGHTANVPAIKIAVEETDRNLGRIIDEMGAHGGAVFVTADHGNAEVNIDSATGEKNTAHTTNPVPAIITGIHGDLRDGGTLADVAPTILGLFGINKPSDMIGESLIYQG